MKVFCTTKNTGPTMSGLDPLHLTYLGTSLKKAIESVGTFRRYEKRVEDAKYWHSALPREVDTTLVRYYGADGWWYSVVSFDLEEA